MHPDLAEIKFTKTQLRILEILSDGKKHAREELIPVCHPSGPKTFRVHISHIRSKISPLGHDIIPQYVYPNKVFWRHVIPLSPTASASVTFE